MGGCGVKLLCLKEALRDNYISQDKTGADANESGAKYNRMQIVFENSLSRICVLETNERRSKFTLWSLGEVQLAAQSKHCRRSSLSAF